MRRRDSLNASVPIQRCTKAEVAVDWVLDIGAFDLKRTLAMDPGACARTPRRTCRRARVTA